MGIIQSAVNQALTTVGVAARLSPDYELKQEKYKTEKEATNLTKQLQVQDEALSNAPISEDNLANLETHGQILKDMEETIETGLQSTRKRFQLDPTKKNYKKFVEARDYLNRSLEGLKYDYEKLVQANEASATGAEVEAEQATQSQAYQQNFIDSVAELKDLNTRKKLNVIDRDEEVMM